MGVGINQLSLFHQPQLTLTLSLCNSVWNPIESSNEIRRKIKSEYARDSKQWEAKFW